MSHLTPDELVDAAERALPAARLAHVASCDACRRDVDLLADLMRETAAAPVPEPSPLFWDRFSARVHEAVAQEAVPSRGWSAWLRWPALVPLGGLALVLAALVATLSRPAEIVTSSAIADLDAPIAAELGPGTDRWDLVAELVGPLDWETAGNAGLAVTPGDVDLVLLELDEDERRELSRLLRTELRTP